MIATSFRAVEKAGARHRPGKPIAETWPLSRRYMIRVPQACDANAHFVGASGLSTRRWGYTPKTHKARKLQLVCQPLRRSKAGNDFAKPYNGQWDGSGRGKKCPNR
jgi:hypothetical protein